MSLRVVIKPRMPLRDPAIHADVFVDGQELEFVSEITSIANDRWSIRFSDEAPTNAVVRLTQVSVPELRLAGILTVKLPQNFVSWPSFDAFATTRVPDRRQEKGHPELRLMMFFRGNRVEEWSRNCSIAEYLNAAMFVINLRNPECSVSVSTDGQLDLYVPVSQSGIEATCVHLRELLKEWRREIEDIVATRAGSIGLALDVPELARVACQQYLLYFLEFLKDLHIEARGSVSEVAGRVLFSVTPTSKDVALERIQEALRVYISLPQGELVGTANDIESQRLEAQIYHLRSQLAFAAALTKTQQATIEAQNVTILTQRVLLDRDGKAPDLEREELLDGTVALTRYKGKGFEVNLPKLFRELRDFLKR